MQLEGTSQHLSSVECLPSLSTRPILLTPPNKDLLYDEETEALRGSVTCLRFHRAGEEPRQGRRCLAACNQWSILPLLKKAPGFYS